MCRQMFALRVSGLYFLTADNANFISCIGKSARFGLVRLCVCVCLCVCVTVTSVNILTNINNVKNGIYRF